MKRKKEIRRTPAPKERKPARSTPAPPATPSPTPVAPATTPAAVATKTPAKSRPVARFRRTGASPAQQRGADLVRYLRIHLKHPYGERGIAAIEKLAREVAHLANLELTQRNGEN